MSASSWIAAAAALFAVPAAAQQATPTTGQASPIDPQGDTQSQPATGAGDAPAPEEPNPSALTADTRRPPPPGLIGDWLEIRTRLARRGIGLTARYASESAYNFTGGERRLFRETGQLDAGVLLDLNKVMGLKGGAFQGTVTFRRGRDLTTDAGLGALQQVQEVYGRGQTLRVTQLWYEQVLGEKLEVKLGLTNPGEDFAAFSCQFMNLSFCGAQPGNLAGDYWYNWPVSQLGARVRVKLDDTHYVTGAVYQINPRNLNDRFFVAHVDGGTGVLVPVEAGWTRKDATGRVGTYKFGGWIGTADGDDVFLDINRRPAVVTGLSPLRRSSRYGVYVNAEQQLTGRSRDGAAVSGLSVFANVTQTDRQTSVTDNQVSIGLFYRGLYPKLRGEVLGVALARTNVNGRVARAQRLDQAMPTVQDSAEYAAEVYYSVQPLEGLELRPNVQWIHHPGGVRSADDVGVIGLKAAVTL
ncbi:carbohydrate porin [Sphingomonas sp. KR1UV-12]|uniref:Carbohydrate porin n=1 Tax=Sphingomonas aurea TaxID=3063994 RepID=A0ABT9EMP0_9SPHN|nr:carbohydrate porin [Sphingomonas sp. KR1UV-12]MDP1028225.1 carbohydrate porin [Sphingomonas sp. KR1UV-12]